MTLEVKVEKASHKIWKEMYGILMDVESSDIKMPLCFLSYFIKYFKFIKRFYFFFTINILFIM